MNLCSILLLNFEDLIQKLNETIYLSHFYNSDHFLITKRCLNTICSSSRKFWWVQYADAIAFSGSSRVFYLSIFIHYDVKNCPVCSIGMFYTILFTWKFFNYLARVLNFQHLCRSVSSSFSLLVLKIMAVKNFVFRENWIGSKVTVLKTTFFAFFDPNWAKIWPYNILQPWHF